MENTPTKATKPQILYVDDEPNNLIAFRSVFRRTYNVATASSAAEAISMLETGNFALILSDYKMPGMTGVDLCKYIKTHFPNLERMIISGYTHEEEIQDAVAEGIIAKSINKPWDTQQLSSEIQALIT
ncbi:MAG: response regulator [Bacteroidota bacterium]